MSKTETAEWPVSEITAQVEMTRATSGGALGNVHFSAKYFRDNYKNVTDVFMEELYSEPAAVPQYPWLN